jgi:acetolactate synthase-1/2/3 large subunit
MVLLVGQVPTDHQGKEAFQEVDYCSFFADLAKWVVEVKNVDDLPEIMNQAFAVATEGRPGPVVVALPENVLRAETTVSTLAPLEVHQAQPTAADLAAWQELLNQAQRPVVLAGGGGWTTMAREHLRQWAEQNELPVVAAFRRHDLMDNNSDCYAGEAGVAMPGPVRQTLAQADLVMALGVRFGEMTTSAYTLFNDPDQKIVHAHAAQEELGKVVVPTLALHAGPNALLAALLAEPKINQPKTIWRNEARQRFLSTHQVTAPATGVDMAAVTTHLQAVLPADVIITNGAGNFAVWPNKFFLYGAEATLLAPQNGTMGYGLPAAVAAKVVHPDRTVVCFAGDGDLQMNIQELGSAQQEAAQPIVLVVNNSTYGTIRMHQERRHPGRVVGTDIVNPDFVTLAQAYGFYAEQVTNTQDFAGAFERASASTTGALLNLMVDPNQVTPWSTVASLREGQ